MRLPAIIVHGGAGRRDPELEADSARGCERAAAAGWAVLAGGGAAVEAVVAAVVVLEDDPTFNAAVGSVLTETGGVEMDASLMDGADRRAGAVAVVTTVRNPILAARAVWRDGRHVLLAGPAADGFARARGLAVAAPESFVTERQRGRWERRGRAGAPDPAAALDPGTVGAVAVDRHGHVASATSTGGMLGKLPGRIGDSAIIGAGTYADDRAGAASATGHGEAIMLAGLARAAVDGLRGGRAPDGIVRGLLRALRGDAPRSGAGLIVVDRFGRCAAAHIAEHMSTATRAG